MVLEVQPNYKIHLLHDYKTNNQAVRSKIQRMLDNGDIQTTAATDNPDIPSSPSATTGVDPLSLKQWGMIDIGVKDAWNITKGNPQMIVAVIDTGVDYTHEDLVGNMWRNSGETGKDAQGRDKTTNGVDDDGNGYIDDVVGWDFATNDNKPYDLAVDPFQLLMGGGNPGHGTHCAGNVAAVGDNGKGIAGVAPNIKIMALRFITEKGQGTTAGAIQAIKYAVENGAKVTSNSWGSEGEDPADGQENKALRDVIKYAEDKGVLFVAAAGNGHEGKGYDNDTDPKPGYPASYDDDTIISVAALDNKDQLGAFSNWGARTVDIGAPGVDVFSTTVGNNYSDKVIDMFGITVGWDGTSMATPHVAGAAALYWSAHPEKNWQEVKSAILGSAAKIPSLANKCVSGGKLDVKALMKY
jgi:subtilisin family serine protease